MEELLNPTTVSLFLAPVALHAGPELNELAFALHLQRLTFKLLTRIVKLPLIQAAQASRLAVVLRALLSALLSSNVMQLGLVHRLASNPWVVFLFRLLPSFPAAIVLLLALEAAVASKAAQEANVERLRPCLITVSPSLDNVASHAVQALKELAFALLPIRPSCKLRTACARKAVLAPKLAP